MQRGADEARKRHWAAGIPLAVLGICLLGSAVHLEKQGHDFESRAVHAMATIIQTVQEGKRSNQNRSATALSTWSA
ncbi:putative protein OS=Kitasatospora aureofaciens OX=1894 GN=HS99_0004220 PE=4 SV=1 [Kitasatospora aureofaciens]